MYGLGAGDPGDPGCGDHAGLYPGLNPLSLGLNPAAPGVIPLPIDGDHGCAYEGVAPWFHGVIWGEPTPGLPAAPKNIPVATPGPIIPPPTFVGISIPSLHFSASNIKSKQPVPILAN